jgi:hypothetical protein
MNQLAPDAPPGVADPGHNSKTTSPWRDIAGWIILAWVVVWSAVYFQSAVLHRFPGLLDWIRTGP